MLVVIDRPSRVESPQHERDVPRPCDHGLQQFPDHLRHTAAMRLLHAVNRHIGHRQHARTRAARFLGYEIIVRHDDSKITGGRRVLNGMLTARPDLAGTHRLSTAYRPPTRAAHSIAPTGPSSWP